MFYRLRRFRTSVLLIFLFASTGWGQNRTSSMTGTVKDTSGSVVVDARIHVRHVSTSRIRSTISDRNGLYRVPLLEVGAYEVTAEKEGFKSSRHQDVILELDREAVVDHLLLIGDLTESVVISGEASTIAAVSSALTGLVDSTTIGRSCAGPRRRQVSCSRPLGQICTVGTALPPCAGKYRSFTLGLLEESPEGSGGVSAWLNCPGIHKSCWIEWAGVRRPLSKISLHATGTA